MNIPGKGEATASFVIGILSLACMALGAPIFSLILGLIGVVLAIYSKRAGYNSGLRVTGLILSCLPLGLLLLLFLFP